MSVDLNDWNPNRAEKLSSAESIQRRAAGGAYPRMISAAMIREGEKLAPATVFGAVRSRRRAVLLRRRLVFVRMVTMPVRVAVRMGVAGMPVRGTFLQPRLADRRAAAAGVRHVQRVRTEQRCEVRSQRQRSRDSSPERHQGRTKKR